MKKIANWFGNNAAKKDPPGGSKKKSGKTSFTVRDVVIVNYRDCSYGSAGPSGVQGFSEVKSTRVLHRV